MQAHRIVTQVDSTGHLTGLPLLPPGRMVEVIMLVMDQQSTVVRRKPPLKLRGKIVISGDVLTSVSPSDWGMT